MFLAALIVLTPDPEPVDRSPVPNMRLEHSPEVAASTKDLTFSEPPSPQDTRTRIEAPPRKRRGFSPVLGDSAVDQDRAVGQGDVQTDSNIESDDWEEDDDPETGPSRQVSPEVRQAARSRIRDRIAQGKGMSGLIMKSLQGPRQRGDEAAIEDAPNGVSSEEENAAPVRSSPGGAPGQ